MPFLAEVKHYPGSCILLSFSRGSERAADLGYWDIRLRLGINTGALLGRTSVFSSLSLELWQTVCLKYLDIFPINFPGVWWRVRSSLSLVGALVNMKTTTYNSHAKGAGQVCPSSAAIQIEFNPTNLGNWSVRSALVCQGRRESCVERVSAIMTMSCYEKFKFCQY